MLKASKLAAIIAVGVIGLMLSAPAQAQATRTWVSGVGDDANPCSRTAPCKTLAGAISKTAAGGEINTLDPGGYGALTITKAISIINDGAGTAGILVSGTNGFLVSAAATDVVVIRGFDFEGLGSTAGSLNGIKILTAKSVHIENCEIRGFGSTNGFDGNGVFVAATSNTEVDITDTQITDNFYNGVLVQPSGNSIVKFTMTRVGVLGNTGNGVKVDSSSLTGGSIFGSLKSVNGSANAGGLSTNATSIPITVMVEDSTFSNNSSVAMFNGGSVSNIFVGRTILSGNGQAFAISAGRINSYGDNDANGNTTGSAPSSPVVTRS